MRRGRALAFLSGALAFSGAVTWGAPAQDRLVYFGTYTGTGSRGIYVSRFDEATGRLTAPELAASTANPSFLVAHPGGRYLYAVNELDSYDGEKAGAATAFAVDRSTGLLEALSQVSTRGSWPCHVSLDREARHAFVANYGGGSLAVLPIRDDGSLGRATAFVQHVGHGPNAERQEAPHAHEALLGRDERLWAADLGLDAVLAYRYDPALGALATPADVRAVVAPGSGPRHFAFSRDGRRLYVLSEMALTVTVFRVEATAATATQTVSTLPDGAAPTAADSAAEIEIHPSGRFLYASNRGPDSIAVFAVDASTGALTRVEIVPSGGKTPRGFALDPSGRFLVVGNQDSNDVAVFAVDDSTGRLARVGEAIHVVAPVSVAFLP